MCSEQQLTNYYRPLNVNKTGTLWGSFLFKSVGVVDTTTTLLSYVVNSQAGGNDWQPTTKFGVTPKRYQGTLSDIRLGGTGSNPTAQNNSGGTIVVQGVTYLVLFKVENLIASGGTATSQTITSWILSAAQYDNFKSGGLTEAELNAATQGAGAANVMQKTSLTATQKASFSTSDYLTVQSNNAGDFMNDEFRFSDTSLAEVAPTGTPAADMYAFGPGATIGAVTANAAAISWTVPYGSNVTALAPTYTLSAGATCPKASGSTQDFTSPVHYIVTSSDSLFTIDYTVTVSVTPASPAKDILAFGPGATISGTNIAWSVPFGTDVTTLAPTYTVSTFASADLSFPSGTARNFTTPQTYTITAQDTTTQMYTVTVTVAPDESTLLWNVAGGGAWDTSTYNWKGQASGLTMPYINGKNVIFDKTNGGTITLAADISPASTTVSATSGTYAFSGSLGGSGSLTKSNGGSLNLDGANTYTGGTVISGGTVSCSLQNASPLGGAGTVNVTVGSGATLAMNRNQITGSLTLNGGKVATSNGWGDDAWNGPVVLSGNSTVDVGSTDGALAFNGVVSGTGSLTKLGTSSRIEGTRLNAANTFSGNLTISQGTIALGAAGSINDVALISIAAGATFDVSAISAYSFTGSNSLSASGTATSAKIKGASGGTVNLGSQPISLTYNGLNAAFTVTQGTLELNGNPFTVNAASPLPLGTHTLASQTSGSITSAGTFPGAIGTAIGAGKVGTISVSGSNVLLTISVPTLEVAGFPGSQTAGVAGSVTVTAKDGAGNTATGYTGTVTFACTDGAALLPANYTFVPADNGVHTFTSGVTLKTVAGGTKSITATVVGTPAITGTQTGITVTPAAAATLTVSGFPASKTAGSAGNVTVTAMDAFNNLATGYTGTVALTSTDGAAVLPANYTFVGGDNGTKVLSVTLNTVSGATVAITATDTVTGSITGTQSGIIVLPNTAAATLQVTGFPSPTTAGVAGSVTITAKTSGGATATNYTGTVTITSTDGAATLPANYTFVAGDNGVHTFPGGVTLVTAAGGAKAITATDTTTLITGSQSGITVNPATAATLLVSGYPSPQFVGTAGDVTVTAVDAFNNTDTAYTGTVAITSTDALATLPSDYTFAGGDSGVHTFTGGVTFATAGPQDITATDTTTFITGTQSAITVNLVPSIFSWVNAAGGFWDNAANWTNDAAISYVPDTAGKENYVLNFNQAGTYTTTQNLANDFLLNQLNFGGAAVTLDGVNSLALTSNGATLPTVNQHSGSGVIISNPVNLAADVTVAGSGAGQLALAGEVSGTGSLTKDSSGVLQVRGIFPPNTYSGGTIINTGTLSLGYFNGSTTFGCSNPLGSGLVTLNSGATIEFNNTAISNDLTVNGGRLANNNGWPSTWSGPITLNATLTADSTAGEVLLSGGISGAGGITKMGGNILKLSGVNTYSGDTTVNAGSITLVDNGGLMFVLTDDASNKVTGPGTANLNGDFTIDTTAVTLTTGTWTLVDTAVKSFDSSFTVVGFRARGDGVTWAMNEPGKTWTFVETTGVLTLAVSSGDYEAWASAYLPEDVSDPVGDNDGDGLTNQQEYAFGLNPTLGSSANPITMLLDKTTGMLN